MILPIVDLCNQIFIHNVNVFQELDKIVMYELKTGGVLLHPIFGGGKEKDKYV